MSASCGKHSLAAPPVSRSLQARRSRMFGASTPHAPWAQRDRRGKPASVLLGKLLDLPLFQRGGGDGGKAVVAAAKRRLLEQLASQQPDTAVISEACDDIMAAQVPFREADLGPGPWTVVYTRGPLLWQGPWTPRGGRVRTASDNQASQDFDPRTRRVINKGELLGPGLAVTASGGYEPVDEPLSSSSGSSSSRCPVTVRASIEGGAVLAWGAEVPLPIRGAGLVEVAYLDASGLRIFRAANGSISVQMREPPTARGGR